MQQEAPTSSTEVTLRDGRTVQVRAAQPSDEAELVQAFGRMSDEARYMRMMHVVREPDRARMHAVLASFPAAGIGRVATVPAADGYDIVGNAIAIFAQDAPSCEFAITVDAAYGGTGLGTALMNALIDEATHRDMRVMEGFVLAQNQPMLRLARKLGFSIVHAPGEATVRICRKALGPAAADAAGPPAAP